ncbi:hypothetical protein ACP70R_016083 [Stipagrostis hirtigluma subsp. patula]
MRSLGGRNDNLDRLENGTTSPGKHDALLDRFVPQATPTQHQIVDPSHPMAVGTLDPHPIEVLVDCFDPFIDEVEEEIERMGAPDLSDTMNAVLDAIEDHRGSTQERREAKQTAMEAEIRRYRAEVEAPAAATVRDRKAFSPSAVSKIKVPFPGFDDDVAFYRQVLDCVEPHLEWGFPLNNCPPGAFISGFDKNLLVLYVGPYRPGRPSPGCYIVYDSWANSVAVVPKLPLTAVSMFSHKSIRTVVAVLCHGEPSDYLVIELLRHLDECGGGADLFLWWSSGPCACQWVQKQVELPLPTNFCADLVRAARRNRLCWIDLIQGALVYDKLLDDHPKFQFTALPKECCIPQGHYGRVLEGLHRSACCVERQDGSWVLKLVTMDDDDCPLASATLVAWCLIVQDTGEPLEWKKVCSICLGDLSKDEDMLAMRPLVPILSTTEDDVIYLALSNPQSGDRRMIKVDLLHRRVLSTVHKSDPEDDLAFPHPFIFASQVNTFLNKRCQWSELQKEREESLSRPRGIDAVKMHVHFSGRRCPSRNDKGLASLLDAVHVG